MRRRVWFWTLVLIVGYVSWAFAATPKPLRLASNFVFLILADEDENGHRQYGTGFCRPNTSDPQIVTAKHIAEASPGLMLVDGARNTHQVRGKWEAKDDDVAILYLDPDATICEENPLFFAKHTPPLGDDIWVIGFGATVRKPSIRRGAVANEIGAYGARPTQAVIDATVIPGDSGSPVFDSMGGIVGIAVGGFGNDQGILRLMVPIERIRKVL